MDIHNFEGFIDKTILDRGYHYYVGGHVIEVLEQDENEYIIQIEGSYDYEVAVNLGNNGEILYSECDCPYDFGPVCKHEVAAYFHLSEMLNQPHEKEFKKSKRPSLQDILHTLPKEELINIIVNITHQDAAMKNSLIVKYSHGDDQQELEACRKLIGAIVKKYTGREGFIKYREARDFALEMGEVADKARNTENIVLALDIALLLLDESIEAFQYADDSDGDIGSLVDETLELIDEIVNESKEAGQQTEVFEKLFKQIDNGIFDGWEDYQIEMLNICHGFADDEIFRRQLRAKMESMLDHQPEDGYVNYRNENLLQLLFRLIERYGTEEESKRFIYENLKFSSFREQLMNRHLEEKNFYDVIEIAKEGEKQDKEYPGLLSKWKKFRYTAYKALSLKEEQEELAKELLLKGDFEYYQDLKNLASGDQEVFYTNLKIELRSSKEWHVGRVFLRLIEEENDLDEMLAYVKGNPGSVEFYAEKLARNYKDEIIEIYQYHIKSVASASSNRRDYQGVCHKISRYGKIAGKQKQTEMVDQLIDLYKKRPAFIDELGKIK